MFTGIIEDVGEVLEIQKNVTSLRMTIRTHIPTSEMREGESISVDGVCLTICGLKENAFTCDVSLETIKVTTLGDKKRGDLVNLERSLKLDGRLHGHIVTGHVECVGTITDKRTIGESIRIEIAIPREFARYVVKKGSIAVDGISLTVNDQSDNRFTVNIVPFTAQKTTIAAKRVGEKVNIETDIIGKYVEKFISQESKGIDYDFLFRYGYIKG